MSRRAVGGTGTVGAALAAAGVLAAVLSASAAPAHASCADDSGPAGSPVVFVGTAQEVRGGSTRIEVEEVWHGPDLAPEVWLVTGEEQPPWPLSLLQSAGSSVDARFESGESYVIGATTDFHANACTITEASSDRAETLRPEDPREPVDTGQAGVDPPLGAVGRATSVAAVVAALGAAVVLRRRRRASLDARP